MTVHGPPFMIFDCKKVVAQVGNLVSSNIGPGGSKRSFDSTYIWHFISDNCTKKGDISVSLVELACVLKESCQMVMGSHVGRPGIKWNMGTKDRSETKRRSKEVNKENWLPRGVE